MSKSAEALSTALEKLSDAYHSVNSAVELVPQCGAYSLLENQVVSVRNTLLQMTEIASALMDVSKKLEDIDLPF